MREAYATSLRAIADALRDGGSCLHCGAHDGGIFKRINEQIKLDPKNYNGIEWSADLVAVCRDQNLNVIQHDLNDGLPHQENKFDCVFALSVLEHILNCCAYLRESHRVLKPGGVLVLLTPNISTLFTIVQLMVGKMPSTGPHPDSNRLMESQEPLRVPSANKQFDTEGETPVYRHLVVFSYRVLRQYLGMIGFDDVKGYGYGLYPFPNFMQPIVERIDPYHCHQMVFVAKKAYR